MLNIEKLAENPLHLRYIKNNLESDYFCIKVTKDNRLISNKNIPSESECTNCIFYDSVETYKIDFLNWLFSEYTEPKKEIKMTKKEKMLLEYFEIGYIVRQGITGSIVWYNVEPEEVDFSVVSEHKTYSALPGNNILTRKVPTKTDANFSFIEYDTIYSVKELLENAVVSDF